MFRKGIFAIGAMLLAAGVCLAQQPAQSTPEIKKESIKHTNPASGQDMYKEYCAPCHGVAGKGDGPAAAAMKTPPTDLTQLAKTHDGKYPANLVSSTLKFGSGTLSHGSSDMPVWGPLFRSLDKYNDVTPQQRMSNLVRYIETLQAK